MALVQTGCNYLTFLGWPHPSIARQPEISHTPTGPSLTVRGEGDQKVRFILRPCCDQTVKTTPVAGTFWFYVCKKPIKTIWSGSLGTMFEHIVSQAEDETFTVDEKLVSVRGSWRQMPDTQ